MNGAATLVLPIERGESKTPSSYDKIAICVSFFSRRPHAAPDRLCDPTMTHARSCGAFGAYREGLDVRHHASAPRRVGDAGGWSSSFCPLLSSFAPPRATCAAGVSRAARYLVRRARDGSAGDAPEVRPAHFAHRRPHQPQLPVAERGSPGHSFAAGPFSSPRAKAPRHLPHPLLRRRPDARELAHHWCALEHARERHPRQRAMRTEVCP